MNEQFQRFFCYQIQNEIFKQQFIRELDMMESLFKDTWVLHKQVCHVTRTEENRSVIWMIYSLIYLAVEISGSILVREVALAEYGGSIPTALSSLAITLSFMLSSSSITLSNLSKRKKIKNFSKVYILFKLNYQSILDFTDW